MPVTSRTSLLLAYDRRWSPASEAAHRTPDRQEGVATRQRHHRSTKPLGLETARRSPASESAQPHQRSGLLPMLLDPLKDSVNWIVHCLQHGRGRYGIPEFVAALLSPFRGNGPVGRELRIGLGVCLELWKQPGNGQQ